MLLQMLVFQNENFALQVSLTLMIRLSNFRVKVFSSLSKELVEIRPKR